MNIKSAMTISANKYIKTYLLIKSIEKKIFSIINNIDDDTNDNEKEATPYNKNSNIKSKRQINHRIAFRPVNVRKYKQKRSVRL
jgi:hypothetical protein